MRARFWKIVGGLCALVLVLGAGGATAQLRITEVLSAPATDWDGDGAVDTKLDEWIEVTNTGAVPAELDALYLRDATGTAWHFGFSGTLAPGATLLVTGTDALQWQADNSAGSSALSLNNSGDRLEIWHAPEGGIEVLVDAVDVPAHAAADDRALGWFDAGGTWILHDGLNPYGGELVPTGTGCEPSPGMPNLCSSLVPVEGTSVGRLKSVYEG